MEDPDDEAEEQSKAEKHPAQMRETLRCEPVVPIRYLIRGTEADDGWDHEPPALVECRASGASLGENIWQGRPCAYVPGMRVQITTTPQIVVPSLVLNCGGTVDAPE